MVFLRGLSFVYIFYLVGLSSVLRPKRDTLRIRVWALLGVFFWDGYPYIHGTGGGAGRVTRLPVCASFWISNGGGEKVEFWLWIPGGCMAKYLEYVISSLCPVCFACAWGVGVGLGRMRWGDCCGSAGSWRHEKGERLGLLTLGFDLDTTVVSLLSPAGHKLSSTDTIVAVFCCGGRRYDETAARHAQNHTLRRNVKPSRDRNGRPWL